MSEDRATTKDDHGEPGVIPTAPAPDPSGAAPAGMAQQDPSLETVSAPGEEAGVLRDSPVNDVIVKKWGNLHRRVLEVRPSHEWLRCQVGRIHQEVRVPLHPAVPVFELLGFGPTMVEANIMAEARLR